jgi:hypothetical protein
VAEAIRFYADVHVPRSVTLALRRRGVDVLTAQDMHMELATDEEHLAYATQVGAHSSRKMLISWLCMP